MTDEGLFLALSILLFSFGHWLGGTAALLMVFIIALLNK